MLSHCPDNLIISLFHHPKFILKCPSIKFLISDSYLSYVVHISILKYLVDWGTAMVISICNLIGYFTVKTQTITAWKISPCYVLFLPLVFWFVWNQKQMVWIKLTCSFMCGTTLTSRMRWPLFFSAMLSSSLIQFSIEVIGKT